MFKREVRKYENGLKHIHYTIPFLKTMTMSFVVKTGSASERYHKHYGISHFLEHMIFNGSDKYPDAKEMFKLASKHGLYQNAWTWNSETLYYTGTMLRSAKVAFDILFDNLFNPFLRESDIEKEIGIIQEERVMGEQRPEMALLYELHQQLFVGTTYAHRVIGDEVSIGGMNQQLLKDYHKTHYSPNNILFITYGGVEFDTISEIVSHKLETLVAEDIPEHTYQLAEATEIERYEDERKTVFIERETDVVFYQFMSVVEPPKKIDDIASAIVLKTILASGQAALYDQELLVNRSLVSDYDAELYITRDHMLYLLDTQFDPAKEDDAIKAVASVMDRFTELTDDTAFERAQNYAFGKYLRFIEDPFSPTSTNLMNIERYNYNYTKEYSLGDLGDAIKKVKKKDVINYANKVFNSERQISGFVHNK